MQWLVQGLSLCLGVTLFLVLVYGGYRSYRILLRIPQRLLEYHIDQITLLCHHIDLTTSANRHAERSQDHLRDWLAHNSERLGHTADSLANNTELTALLHRRLSFRQRHEASQSYHDACEQVPEVN